MAYLVLARKYRPQTFDAVVGQAHVTQTLTNAITSDRVAHAILFTGPRGTGKTTVARILAKAMNCATGPTPTPCNTCRSCEDITLGHGADVYEIDGASNNSVDQVRDLRETIKYMPAHSPYKIYIIDEVHMLSVAAFNALLKTLEEPPAHVKFFFATTEPHKIPITILSRCQRHDLRRVDMDPLIAHLKLICHQEDRPVPLDCLTLIAREGAGSVRDAMSLLDQVLGGTIGEIHSERVAQLLGTVERGTVLGMVHAIVERDIGRLLASVAEAYDRGADLKRLFNDLIAHFRHVTMLQIARDNDRLVDLPESDRDALGQLARTVPAPIISQIFGFLFRAGAMVHQASDPKLAMEMIFVELQNFSPASPVDDLIEEIHGLRRQLAQTPAVGAAPLATPPSEPATVEPATVEPATAEPGPASTPPAPSAPATPRPPESVPQPDSGFDNDAGRLWTAMARAMAEDNPAMAALFTDGAAQWTEDHRLNVVVGGNAFQLQRAQRPKTIAALEAFAERIAGRPLGVTVSANPDQTDAPAMEKKKTGAARQSVLNHPLVKDAIEIFGGDIVDIKSLEEE